MLHLGHIILGGAGRSSSTPAKWYLNVQNGKSARNKHKGYALCDFDRRAKADRGTLC